MSEIKPVAWLHIDRPEADVITDKVKHVWNGVYVGKLAAYSIPLYTEDAFNERIAELEKKNASLIDINEKHNKRIAALESDALEKAGFIVAQNNELIALREQVAKLEGAIRWALGETNFPSRKEGQGQFYWRIELRKRSGLIYTPPQEQKA